MPKNPPKAKPKPELPAPTFKYGSATYVCLAYAKMVNKPFGIINIRQFTYRYKTDYEVKRSLDVLVKNGSIKKVTEDTWEITPKGITHVYDFAKRRELAEYPSSY